MRIAWKQSCTTIRPPHKEEVRHDDDVPTMGRTRGPRRGSRDRAGRMLGVQLSSRRELGQEQWRALRERHHRARRQPRLNS